MHRALPPPLLKIKKCVYRYDFIVTARRENNTFAVLSSPLGAETIFVPVYRRRAAREQYLCRLIVTARRGNNIFTGLSSPLGAETIFMPFYRRRSARERYLCRFIVTVQRGNDIFANLSSPCSAGTIFVRFSACSVIASIKILFPPLQNGDVCWNGRGGCLCARPNVRVAAFPYLIDTFSNRKMEGLSSCSKNVVSI